MNKIFVIFLIFLPAVQADNSNMSSLLPFQYVIPSQFVIPAQAGIFKKTSNFKLNPNKLDRILYSSGLSFEVFSGDSRSRVSMEAGLRESSVFRGKTEHPAEISNKTRGLPKTELNLKKKRL